MHNKLPEDILRKIKQIKIATRRALNGQLVGDSRTAIKGVGFDFDQIRAYSPGDDVRFIDWKASARTDNLVIKQYIEERNRTVHLLVDISRSGDFTTTKNSKRDLAAQIASIIAISSFYGKDRVGLTLFSNYIEHVIPPSSQLHHVDMCVEKLFAHEPKHHGTNVSAAIDRILRAEKKSSLVFIISDFIDELLDEKKLGNLAKKHDVVAVRCLDECELKIPSVGIVHVQDIETGRDIVIDTGDAHGLQQFFENRIAKQNKIFAKYGIDLLEIFPRTQHLVTKIVGFFKKRMRY